MLLELVIVVLLIVVNGFFAMSELAVVSARRTRVAAMADAGKRGARLVLDLIDQPSRFLSAVQIGITLVGLLAGAFSGATLAQRLASTLVELGVSIEIAETLGFVTVVLGVGYLSLIVGELVPKQLALKAPERIAAAVARPMQILSWLAAPAIWLLEISSKTMIRLLGVTETSREQVSEEEIKTLIAEAESAGVVGPEETRMISRVMRLRDLPVRAVMTPRPQLDWIDLQDTDEKMLETLLASPHSRLLVTHGQLDEATAVIAAKDALTVVCRGEKVDFASLAQSPPIVHDGADVLSVIQILKNTPIGMVLVVDEYGTLEGIVTSADVLGAIAGELSQPGDEGESDAVQREDGSWLLDGTRSIEMTAELLGLKLPEQRDYHTLAGFMLDHLRRLPHAGDGFTYAGWRFEVLDMDGRRIDKVLASQIGHLADEAQARGRAAPPSAPPAG